jgi:hypothetical protein
VTSDPQFGQRGASDVPQVEQNRAPAALSAAQFGQAIVTGEVYSAPRDAQADRLNNTIGVGANLGGKLDDLSGTPAHAGCQQSTRATRFL